MFLFLSVINRREQFCLLSQNFTYLVLTRLAVNIPLVFTSANSGFRESGLSIPPGHTKECCRLRKFIAAAGRRSPSLITMDFDSQQNHRPFAEKPNCMMTWPHAHYVHSYHTIGTKRLLCSTACSISKVQISEATEARLKINKKVSAVASTPR